MTQEKFQISDHAVLRYLERVEGVDIASTRAKIRRAVSRTLDANDEFGAAPCGVIADGFTYKIRNGTVTTVVPSHRPNLKTSRKRKK